MDPVRFDQLSARLARRHLSRRHALRGLGAAGLASALFALRHQPAAADCRDIVVSCRHYADSAGMLPGPVVGSLGGPVGACWDWATLQCYPCHTSRDQYAAICNQTFPAACDGMCFPNYAYA
jgi:hypothetical protein